MNETDIPINIELGEHGLYYGTSPAMKGLLVTGESIKDVMEKVPSAIAEMRAVECRCSVEDVHNYGPCGEYCRAILR